MSLTDTQPRNSNTAPPITQTPSKGGALTLREAVLEFEGQLVARSDDFAPSLPSHISPERFRRTAVTAVNLNPDLLDANRLSLFNACAKAASDGLLPDGREGALVIFNTREKFKGQDGVERDRWVKKVQWMPMVYGIIKKARQSGEVATLSARIVYENELKPPTDANGNVLTDGNGKPLPPRFRFFIEDGEDRLIHDPILFGDRGPAVGVYARVKFKDGSIEYEPLNKADVEKIRAVSKSKDGGPWTQWWEEMAKKSAIRRLAKRLPLSAELQATISRDDEMTEYDQIKAAERARMIGAAAKQLGAPMLEQSGDADEDGQVTDAEEDHDEETGEVESDEIDSYLTKMVAEYQSAKTTKDKALVDRTFKESVVAHVDRKEIAEERGSQLVTAWNAATAGKK